MSGEWITYGSRQVEQKPLGEPRHTIRNLTPGTYYKIEIRAHNTIGNSLPSTTYIKTSLPPTGNQLLSPITYICMHAHKIITIQHDVTMAIYKVVLYELTRKFAMLKPFLLNYNMLDILLGLEGSFHTL